MTPPGLQAPHPRGHGLLTSVRLISGLTAATIILNNGFGAYFELYDGALLCVFQGLASLSKTHHTEACSCDPHTFAAADRSMTREVCPALGRASGPRGTAARCLILSFLSHVQPPDLCASARPSSQAAAAWLLVFSSLGLSKLGHVRKSRRGESAKAFWKFRPPPMVLSSECGVLELELLP